jgi:hypothetical protein
MTDVKQFMGEIGGGVFEQKIAGALSDVAANVMANNKAGKVTITFDLKKMNGDTGQVMIKHSLNYQLPTNRGKRTETDVTETPMYVGRAGKMSIANESQNDLFMGAGISVKTSQEKVNVH